MSESEKTAGGRGIRARKKAEEPSAPPKSDTPRRRESDERRSRQWEFWGPILWVLLRKKGEQATAQEVIDEVGEMMSDRLSHTDYELLANEEERWRSTCRFARMELIDAGYLDSNAPRGIWRLS